MSTFTLYVQDARYNAPTLHFLLCDGEEEARRRALNYLADSHHHLGAEVFLEGERVIALSRADLMAAGK